MQLSETCSYCRNEVPAPSQQCPHCGQPGKFWNVIAAKEPDEVTALDQRYQLAQSDATRRRANVILQDFEKAIAGSKAVIARYQSEVLRLAGSTRQLYATYYQLIDSGLRLPEGDEWDMLRELAETVLFSGYKQHIRFGALSLDGRGLPNYGECAIVLRDGMIADRASVFEENSALFVERQKIRISRKSKVPKGYRAPWNERAKLGVAKLYGRIDPTTTPDKYSQILLRRSEIGRRRLH